MYIKDVLDHLKVQIYNNYKEFRSKRAVPFLDPMLCRESNRGPMYLAAGRRANHWVYTQHPYELRHTPMSYATPQWATPHPNELRHTPMSYATPQWATAHPNELRHTPLSYATPQWATPHPMSYATNRWATPHPLFTLKFDRNVDCSLYST
jgi:hypothetical protein